METKVKRPPSVWITQIIFAIYGLVCLLTSPLSLTSRAFEEVGVRPAVTSFIITFGCGMVLGIGFVALMKKWQYARWLGSFALLLLMVQFFFGRVEMGKDAIDPLDRFEEITVSVVTALWFVIFILLIWRLLFGSAANAFFAKPISGE